MQQEKSGVQMNQSWTISAVQQQKQYMH